MSTAITIEGIVKRYGTTAAVDGISLAIEPGELFFLLGPSGCGKTTLLRMIAGFLEPTAGRILFKTAGGERDVTYLAANKRNTGMVFQSYALWPHMTVAANVAFGLDVRKVEAGEKARRVSEALALVQMESYAQRKPNALSGGQQQRVALARALVVRPDVLLLDEPLSNLDAKLRIELRGEIRRICKTSGITTVYVTHDQKEALSMADRMAVLAAGRLVQVGSPGEMYRNPSSRFVAEFLGETNFIEARVESASGSGARLVTPFGTLVSARSTDRAQGGTVGGTGIVVSLRPEALRAARDGEVNALRGRVVETTYLGEIAQQVVELKGTGGETARLRVSLLNPSAIVSDGQEVSLAVSPEDVVLVPAGGSG